MSRPIKCRLIKSEPGVALFKPCGVPAKELENVNLTYEELEAVRLKDVEGLDQTGAAALMNISRATFQRILCSARFKIGDALVNGKAIRIEGGNYSISGMDATVVGCGLSGPGQNEGVCPKRMGYSQCDQEENSKNS